MKQYTTWFCRAGFTALFRRRRENFEVQQSSFPSVLALSRHVAPHTIQHFLETLVAAQRHENARTSRKRLRGVRSVGRTGVGVQPAAPAP